MSLFLIKSILGSIFLLAGLIALLSMFTIMGKQEKKSNALVLKRVHKITGFIFFFLMLLISYFCLKYWAQAGDQISARAALHGVLAFGLLIVLLLKISIVRIFKQFLHYAPTMGMIVFSLAFVVFSTSAGYYFLRSFCTQSSQNNITTPVQTSLNPDAEQGAALYANKCSSCHFSDKAETLLGPGLSNLLKNEILPSSKKPATEENIKNQLLKPFRTMPPFPNFTEQELADLMAFLKTL